ncbi:MAG: glycosyltransferase [Bdellovibrionota bacterium]
MDSRRFRVYLTGGDLQGWALDTDLKLAKKALSGVVDFVSDPHHADVIHTVWPEQLLEKPELAELRKGKPIVATFSNDPHALFEKVPGLYDDASEWYCVGQSRDAVRKLKELSIPSVECVPYIADLESFKPLLKDDPELLALKAELKIPRDKYLIGSFQRDSLGSNLRQFKAQKGADALLSIALGLKQRVGANGFHVVLAGPRRHWIMDAFEKNAISYSFDGEFLGGDDYPKNIRSAERINQLKNLLDVYLITSRWEGGPRAVLEAAASKTPVISTAVGVVPDILNPVCIYKNLSQAIDLLESDFKSRHLRGYVDEHFVTVNKNHSVEAIHGLWKNFYANLGSELKPSSNRDQIDQKIQGRGANTHFYFKKALFKASKVKQKLIQKIRSQSSRKATITLWGEMVAGPYGGGSQVLKAIARELESRGFEVLNNSYTDADGHILNSAFFDTEKLKTVLGASQKKPKVVHRIDGPISLYRGKDLHLDQQIFRLNREAATATAFQCVYSWRESLNMGFRPVNPMIIRNACDPSLFFKPVSKAGLDASRKVKLISTCWSTNKIKGFDVYRHLDETLDFSKYDYTFVGRSPVEFKNIRLVDAVASKELGDYLRQADVFITASRNDPASNSLLEALNCGLPAIYAQSGGHSEFTWFAGLSFQGPQEIAGLLERIERDYRSYQLSCYSISISEAVDSYLQALGLCR